MSLDKNKPPAKGPEKKAKVEKPETKPEIRSEILDGINAKLKGVITDSKVQRERRLVITIDSKDITEVCQTLFDMGFDHLSNVSGVEYEDRFESVYHVWSYSNNNLITVKAVLPKERPKIDSVTSIWKSADWHEREAYDLMGIKYKGHPNLTRILNPDDFEGHPLRKSFELSENPWYDSAKSKEK